MIKIDLWPGIYVYNFVFQCIQAKCCDLDSRLLALSKDKEALKQKIDALQVNADKLNPNKKVVAKETVRYMHVEKTTCI